MTRVISVNLFISRRSRPALISDATPGPQTTHRRRKSAIPASTVEPSVPPLRKQQQQQMSAFACANTWLAFVRADQKPNAEEEVTSAREPSGSEDEDDGRPRANFADAGLDKFPIDSQQQRQQDSLSQEDKNERLYERLAELSGQALTEENRSQGIFCPTQGESDEASEASKTSDDDATPPRNEPPATIPVRSFILIAPAFPI